MNRFSLIFCITLSCVLFLTACNQDADPIYYKAMGEGYVYDITTKEPVPFFDVAISNCLHSNGTGGSYIDLFPSTYCILDYFTTDENGFYRAKFAKRYNQSKAIYDYSLVSASAPCYHGDEVNYDKKFLQKQKKTFKIDTLWIKKHIIDTLQTGNY